MGIEKILSPEDTTKGLNKLAKLANTAINVPKSLYSDTGLLEYPAALSRNKYQTGEHVRIEEEEGLFEIKERNFGITNWALRNEEYVVERILKGPDGDEIRSCEKKRAKVSEIV